MRVPHKVRNNFEIDMDCMHATDGVIKGTLICCDEKRFTVSTFGMPKKHFFSKVCLYPVEEKMALSVCCINCGKQIQVFNSLIDGYDQYHNFKNQKQVLQTVPFSCAKCGNNNYRVNINYEYPELDQTNAHISCEGEDYTWIWVTLYCNCCGTVYRNFIDFETG